MRTQERDGVGPAHPRRPPYAVTACLALEDGEGLPPWVTRLLARRPARWWATLSESRRAPWAWRILVPLNLVLLLTLARLDAALRVLHVPGDDGYGIASLGKTSAAEAALEQWERVSEELANAGLLRPRVTGVVLATIHSVVDVLFALAWPTLLALAAIWLCRYLAQARERSWRARPAAVLLGVSLLALPVAVAVDVAENLAQLAVVHRGVGWAQVLRLAMLTKWAVVLLAVIPVLIGLAVVGTGAGNPVRAFLGAVRLLRIQAAIVAIFAVVLLVASTKDQAQDVLRTWSTKPWWALWGVLGVAVLALCTGVSSARVIAMSRTERRPPPPPKFVLLVGVAVGAVGAALWVRWQLGEGLAVGGFGLVAIAGLSSVIHGPAARERAREESDQPVRPIPGPPTRSEGERQDEAGAWLAVPALLAAAPLAILGLAILAALIPEVLGQGSVPAMLVVLAPGLQVLAVVAHVICAKHVKLPSQQDPELISPGFLRIVVVTGLGVAAFGLAVHTDPFFVGGHFGAIGLVGFFLAGAMILVALIAIRSERYDPPAALAILGFRRIPIILLVVAWGVVAVWADGDSTLHDARIMRGAAAQARLSVDQYTERWISERTATVAATAPATGPRPGVPLVFVSAAGGGIKAASWTALVVDCAFGRLPQKDCQRPRWLEDGAWPSLFAMSGASGGSVGLASALAEHLGNPGKTDWVRHRLGSDLASASLGWQLFAEAPLSLFRLPPGGRDRAEVLESSWSRRWAGVKSACLPEGDINPTEAGIFRLWSPAAPEGTSAEPDCRTLPPLLLPNGTSLVDGCRFNASVLDTAAPMAGTKKPVECAGAQPHQAGDDQHPAPQPAGGAPYFAATRDLADLLCPDEDVNLATAAFLSARFPFFSPTGRIAGPAKRGRTGPDRTCGTADPSGVVFVGDGGYRDNTGASAVLELWNRVQFAVDRHNRGGGPCLVPVFLQIDSGYDNRSAPRTGGRLFEAAGPLTGAISVFGTRDKAWPQMAANRFSGPLAGGDHVHVRPEKDSQVTRFFSFSLRGHPAVQAPLGWSLSQSAREDLPRQLRLNQAELQRLYSLLRPGHLTCSGP